MSRTDGGRTGRPAGLLQDDSRELSRWFARQPGARHTVRRVFDNPNMNITIYTKNSCPNCVTAKSLLKSKGLRYGEINVEEQRDALASLLTHHPDARQMPQIFIDGQRVGGLAGLQAALKQLGL